MCERGSERERESERKTDRQRERERERWVVGLVVVQTELWLTCANSFFAATYLHVGLPCRVWLVTHVQRLVRDVCAEISCDVCAEFS